VSDVMGDNAPVAGGDGVVLAGSLPVDRYPDDTLLDYGRLRQHCADHHPQYASADPFPHILIEDFISPTVVTALLEGFPAPDAGINWRRIEAAGKDGSQVQYNKQGMPHLFSIPAVARQLIWELNSSTFIRILETLTGIENLIPDPALRGGGLHQVLPGGVLGVHADFTRHAKYNLDRRVNLLVYLNRDWRDDYEGHLELWDRSVSRCVRRIRPLAGRCVIFNTDADSFHGHPRPLACPQGITRKSIAIYYYTLGRNDKDVPGTRATDWQVLPDVQLPPLE